MTTAMKCLEITQMQNQASIAQGYIHAHQNPKPHTHAPKATTHVRLTATGVEDVGINAAMPRPVHLYDQRAFYIHLSLHRSSFLLGPLKMEATPSTQVSSTSPRFFLLALLETSPMPAVLVVMPQKRHEAAGAGHVAFMPVAPCNDACWGQTQEGKRHSEEATVLEVVLDDDVCDSIEHKLDVVGISGTCKVRVDLLSVAALVE